MIRRTFLTATPVAAFATMVAPNAIAEEGSDPLVDLVERLTLLRQEFDVAPDPDDDATSPECIALKAEIRALEREIATRPIVTRAGVGAYAKHLMAEATIFEVDPAAFSKFIVWADGAAGALPLPTLADAPTPIMRLFRQWEQARSDAHGVSDEECAHAVDRMSALEGQMLALPSQSIADLVAKIAAYSDWGGYGLPGEHMLWREMKSIIAAASESGKG